MRGVIRRCFATFLLLIGTVPAGAHDAKPDLEPDDGEPLQIVISLNKQRLAVLRGKREIASSAISTGAPGHSTPPGIYSILHKKKRHFSNLYNGAPMPYMQRLTWTGIALHGSNNVPDYPVSHGCIRLPAGFDQELYEMTSVGAHVIVNGDMLAPVEIGHPGLPNPAPARRYDPAYDHWRLRMEMGARLPAFTPELVSTAQMLAPVRHRIGLGATPATAPPLRILITRRSRVEMAKDVQRLLNKLGYEAGIVDGIVGPATRAAIRRFAAEKGIEATGPMHSELKRALYESAGEDVPKNGKLLVRHDFTPLFEETIAIAEETLPLGTHLLVASGFDRGAGRTGWSAYTLENRISASRRAYYGIDPDADEQVDLDTTLDRIAIPHSVQKRLAALLTPGSSIAIADGGTERFTGWQTDFVVSTNIGRGQEYALVPKKKQRVARQQPPVRKAREAAPRRQENETLRHRDARLRQWQRANPFLRVWRVW